MKSGWKLQKISDISRINESLYSTKDNWPFVDYLDTGNITENVIDSIQRIDMKSGKLPSRARRKVTYNSIIYSTVRPNQRHFGIMKNVSDYLLVSTGFVVIDVNTQLADADFLYFYLSRSDIVEHLHSIAEQSVSAYPSIKASDIENLEIRLPPIHVQRNISAILRILNEKITLNTRINDNLKQQAQTIYVDTFITHANSTWKQGQLSDFVAIKYGKDHKKLANGTIPVYGSGGIMRYVERPLYTHESVLIPRKGTLNNVMYVSEPFWSVDTMFYTEMLRPNVAKFVYHFLSGKNLASMNAGSAVPSMTTDILNAMELPVPDDDSLVAFERIVSPMYQAMFENRKQSDTLAEIRNALLPRLMSGELDVSDIEL